MDQNNITAENLANIIYRIAAELKNDIPGVIERTVDAFAPKEQERIESEVAREAAEVAREAAEVAREENYAKLETRVENMAVGKIFPIGAVYISFEATSPSDLFGGTWEELTSGRFLMASNGDSGLEGGSEGHVHGLSNAGAALAQGLSSGYLEYEVTHISKTTEYGESPVYFYADRTLQTDYIGPYGEQNTDFVRLYGNTDSAASDLPPYITVHMWKRTA